VLKKLLKEVRLLLWHVQEWARRWIYHVTSMAVRERGRRRGLVWCRMDCLGGRPDGSREGNVSALAAREPPHLVDSTGSTYPSYSMNILYLTASSNLCPLTKHQYNMGGHLSSRLRDQSKHTLRYRQWHAYNKNQINMRMLLLVWESITHMPNMYSISWNFSENSFEPMLRIILCRNVAQPVLQYGGNQII
jgi:hypothetical protein